MAKGVLVEYLGHTENYTFRGKKFPCRMTVSTAKALIERNPKTFKSEELEAYLAGGEVDEVVDTPEEPKESDDDSNEE